MNSSVFIDALDGAHLEILILQDAWVRCRQDTGSLALIKRNGCKHNLTLHPVFYRKRRFSSYLISKLYFTLYNPVFFVLIFLTRLYFFPGAL